jgi:hypothetical protein
MPARPTLASLAVKVGVKLIPLPGMDAYEIVDSSGQHLIVGGHKRLIRSDVEEYLFTAADALGIDPEEQE